MSYEPFLRQLGKKNVTKPWEGTFEDYFKIALSNPIITQSSVQRIYNMIMSHGTAHREDGTTEYLFFKGRMFGAEKQIQDIMMYFKAASLGLDIKKRVLLLLGPPGGGKSMFLSLLKKGLADYTRTDKGAIYAIKDCPIHEEPLHLIMNDSDRETLYEKHRIKIEGKLCPVCQFRYENEWNKNIANVEIERVYISEENRTGIGTFAPSEKNDMRELYGAPNSRLADYYGDEADPRAYDFNGELHQSNRGIMEFIEVLKAEPAFLHVLLTLAEEQQFKSPRFPLQYVDECLIAHTNEGEFYRFIAEKENEAIVDRLYIVSMPYNMEPELEEQIYHYALKTKLVVKDVSVHPGAIRLVSFFAIRTRESNDPLRRGMQGLSPRFILNTLALSLVRFGKRDVSVRDMFQMLRSQIYHYPVLSYDKREEYLQYLLELEERLNEFENVRKEDVKMEVRKGGNGNGLFNMIIGD